MAGSEIWEESEYSKYGPVRLPPPPGKPLAPQLLGRREVCFGFGGYFETVVRYRRALFAILETGFI